MKENRSRYAILGILTLGPMSGYDIKQMFQKSFTHFWSESYGQIYPMLKKLSDFGLATRNIQKQIGRPNRHIYNITKKGKKELQKWLKEPVGRQIGRHEILLKLIFGLQVPLSENIRQIKKFREIQQLEMKELLPLKRELQEQDTVNPNLPFWLLSIRYGQLVNQAYIKWAEEALDVLQHMKKKGTSYGKDHN